MKTKKDLASQEAEQLEREMLADIYLTGIKKTQFINELKTGLGAEIKANPNKVKIIKKTLPQKIKMFLTKIFTKF
jgi:hypothetical protein